MIAGRVLACMLAGAMGSGSPRPRAGADAPSDAAPPGAGDSEATEPEREEPEAADPEADDPEAADPEAGEPGPEQGDPQATPSAGGDPSPSEPGQPAAEQRESDPSKPAEAEANKQRAKQHFAQALSRLSEQRYGEAAEAFRASYQAWPTSGALYNMALAYEKDSQPIPAIRGYREYLQRPDVGAQRRREVESSLQRLRRQVGELTLSIPPDVGLEEIRIDGQTVEPDAFPLLVTPGSVQVELIGGEGLETQVRDLLVEPGQRIAIEVTPFVVPRTPPPATVSESPTDPTPTQPPDRGESSRRPPIVRDLFWAGVGLTSAGAVAVGVLGGLAKYEENQFNEQKCPEICTPELREQYPEYPSDHRQRALAFQTATNAMLGITAAFAGTTVILGVLGFTDRRDRTAVAVRPGGFVLHW